MNSALTIEPLAESTFGAVVESLDVETVLGPAPPPEVLDELCTAWIDMTEPRTMWHARFAGDNKSELAALVSDTGTAA